MLLDSETLSDLCKINMMILYVLISYIQYVRTYGMIHDTVRTVRLYGIMYQTIRRSTVRIIMNIYDV